METTPRPAAETADARPRRRRRVRRRKRERGIALLLVLTAVALLTISVVDFQENQIADLQSAYAERDALQAEYMARSAGNLARLWVASEPTMRSGLLILKLFFKGGVVPQLPVWEYTDRILGAFSDKSGQDAFSSLSGFDMSQAKNLGGPDGASFHVVVVDEDAKINLNLGARGNVIAENRFGAAFLGLVASPQYDLLFQRADRDGNPSDRAAICGALMDWADPDENLYACDPRNFQGGGAAAGGEDDSTLLLAKPYRRKNAAYDSLDEAHLVRGMGDDFWATFVDPEPSNPKKRVMTVWGQGPINVNTASAQAIFAVICGLAPDAVICTDPNKSQQFLTMFGVLRSFTAGMPLFGSTTEFVNTVQGGGQFGKLLFDTLQIPPVRFQSPAEAAKNFTTESKIFSIYATGEVTGYRRTTTVRMHMVVDYRGAPQIPNSLTPVGGPLGPGLPGAPTATATPTTTASPTTSASAPASPAGTVIYYRLD
jgi:general secretion pathway protein K